MSVTAEQRIREQYLSDNEAGVASAVRDALQKLFSEQQLPDNPYYYLGNILAALVDQSDIWRLPDGAVCLQDDESSLEVLDGTTKLCKLRTRSTVVGLPHVLRLVSRDGAQTMHDVITSSLPDSFFPSGTTFADGTTGYTMLVLASLQGMALTWHPSSSDLPSLDVRADVVVRGPRLEEAVGRFVALILSDMDDLAANSIYFADGLVVQEAPSAQSSADKRRFSVFISAAEVAGSTGRQEVDRQLRRHVLTGRTITVKGCLLLEAPEGAQRNMRVRYELATKTYLFHFQAQAEDNGPPRQGAQPKLEVGQVEHYATLPHEALFEGCFLDMQSAKQYLALWPSERPYSGSALKSNMESMRLQVERRFQVGETMEAYRQLLLLCLLHDRQVLAASSLASMHVRPLDELLSACETDLGAEGEGAVAMMAIPDLHRILASAPILIEGARMELEAFALAVGHWPARYAAIQAAAAAVRSGGSRAGTAPGGQPDAHADAVMVQMADWLTGFNMESRLLQQLLSLKRVILEATGHGRVSGLSKLINQLVKQLPQDVPGTAEECHQALAATEPVVNALQNLLQAAALTLASGLLSRCPRVMDAMDWLGIDPSSKLSDAGAQDDALQSADWMLFDWVLDVGTLTTAKVKAGTVAERVAVEGVKLQYAADTGLDLVLTQLYMELTSPPLLRNPYPRLVHRLRAAAVKLELRREAPDDAFARMSNELVMMPPPSFVYVAQPSPQRNTPGKRRLAGRQAVALDAGDEDLQVAYGCYAAVALADCRALQQLRDSLPMLLAAQHWQRRAYQVDLVPSLAGDAALSNALRLDDHGPRRTTAAKAGGGDGQRDAIAPFEHPRFYKVEVEHHYLVAGPQLRDAAEVFAEGVVEQLAALCQHTMHLLHSLRVGQQDFAMREFAGPDARETMVPVLMEAVRLATPGEVLARLSGLLAVKEGLYVTATVHIRFQHSDGAKQLLGPSIERPSSGRPSSGAVQRSYWGSDVYCRVFLAESDALTWHTWNRERGDPAQPFHYHAVVREADRQAAALIDSGRFLEAHKVMLSAAVAMQDHSAMLQLAMAMRSTAQELLCLQDIGAALVSIMGPSAPPEFVGRVDAERVRRLFLLFYTRALRAMTSERYCHFPGFTILAPAKLAGLKEHVLSSFTLAGRWLEMMEHLDAWISCCLTSVAAAVHDCLAPDVTGGLAKRLADVDVPELAAGADLR